MPNKTRKQNIQLGDYVHTPLGDGRVDDVQVGPNGNLSIKVHVDDGDWYYDLPNGAIRDANPKVTGAKPTRERKQKG